jgi:hypothetical protein
MGSISDQWMAYGVILHSSCTARDETACRGTGPWAGFLALRYEPFASGNSVASSAQPRQPRCMRFCLQSSHYVRFCRSDASQNGLFGIVPPELGALPNIHTIRLERNNLTGIVPASFFASTSIVKLYAPLLMPVACRSPHTPRLFPSDVQPRSLVWAAVCWRTTNSPESPTSRARTAVRKSSTLGRLLDMINLRTSRVESWFTTHTRASLQPTSADATTAQRHPASGTAPMCALSSA